MAWIESHQSLLKHRKLFGALRILTRDQRSTAGRPAVGTPVDRFKLIGHLHALWWWGLDNADIDGNLGDVDAYQIAAAAEWDGDPKLFLEALLDCGREG